MGTHQGGGVSYRSFRRTEHRRTRYEVADADRADLRQAVDSVPGPGEPFAHCAGNEYCPGLSAENVQRCLPPDQVTSGVFVCPDSERRCHTGEQ
jgi:hypothetical protein